MILKLSIVSSGCVMIMSDDLGWFCYWHAMHDLRGMDGGAAGVYPFPFVIIAYLSSLFTLSL